MPPDPGERTGERIMERETRLDTLIQHAAYTRLEILLDATIIAERHRACLELAELDRRAASSHWVRIGEIVDGVLQDLLEGKADVHREPSND
jgi:hypothetical protein